MTHFDDSLPGSDDAGRAFPIHAPRDVDPDRGLGALMGLAVGDALGTTLEFTRQSVAPLPTLLTGPHVDVIGGGPFDVAPGQVTDDTQMATALTRSMMAEGGFKIDAVAAAYVAWAGHAFDIGNQTHATLSRVARGEAPLVASRAVWEAPGPYRPAGNGSLMRTMPVGVFYASDRARLREVAMLDAAITHFDPRCRIACAAFNAAIATAVMEPTADADAMANAAEQEVRQAAALLRADNPGDTALIEAIDRAEDALLSDLKAAQAPDPQLAGPEVDLAKMAGFVRVAFRLAFWHLHHTASFEAALIDVVNRGADADTNGAIVGALLGARDGAPAIPTPWRQTVSGALEGQTGPWAQTYHPRRLFALLAPVP